MSECSSQCCSCSGTVQLTADIENSAENQIVFLIKNMDCPTEEGLIRSKLGSMSEVLNLDFNLLQHKLTVDHSSAAGERSHDDPGHGELLDHCHSHAQTCGLEAGGIVSERRGFWSADRRAFAAFSG